MRQHGLVHKITIIFLDILFSSHDLIGVFTTSIRELIIGPGRDNNYEVQKYKLYIPTVYPTVEDCPNES